MDDDITRAAEHCPRCDRALPADTPEGLCAACLLGAGIETLTTGSIDDLPTMSSADRIRSGAASDGPRLSEGQAWGTYRIGRLLGRGGMGEVYEAEQVDSGRRLALKVLRGRLQNAEDRARFLREGQLAASISHPHTVYIFGSDEIAGTPVIAMELLPGGTLKDRVVADGPLAPGDAVAAVLDVIGGLDAAQAAGILHRDIKPSNCFVDRDGTVKVGDFGLSISTLARDVHHDVAAGGFEGTPQFAPPEQLRGEPLDVRADIYAVGATLYYLLTGHPPFDAPDLRELFARVTTDVPRSPRDIRPGIPARLAAVVMQCLAKEPADRPASYAALAEVLRPFLPQTETPARPGIRLVAGIVDAAILAVPATIWSMSAVDPLTQTAGQSAVVSMWTSLIGLAYYVVLEGVWGASFGKRLFGLQLATVRGAAPSFLRVVYRSAIYFAVPNVTLAVLFASGLIGADTVNYAHAIIGLALTALLFSTIRRRNGWAAMHDLLTGTRVVERIGFLTRRAAVAAQPPLELRPAAPDGRRRYGPFDVAGDAGPLGEGRLLVGFDPVLRRQVWIHVVAAGVPPVSEARRDVSRIGRLHWLTGRRSSDANWDAYEAPEGRPLAFANAANGSSVPTWHVLKLWLLDLAHELRAAARDGSLPPLSLDRLWLRNDGHLVLLDFPAPGMASRSSGDAARAEQTPVALLAALGARTMAAMQERDGAASLPLSARRLIERWKNAEPLDLEHAAAGLAAVAGGQDEVRRSRRAIPIALAATPALVVVLAAALMLPYLYRFMTNPQTAEILSGLSALQNPNPRDARMRDADVRVAMERYLAGTYGHVLADDGFWSTLIMSRLGNLRQVARELLARHAAVSSGELARAAAVITPERQRWAREANVQRRGLLSIGGIIVSTLTAFALAAVIALGLLSAILAPGGVITRVLGYAVVTDQGREIGRGRSLLRHTVAWAPALVWLAYLAVSPKMQGYVPAPPAPWLGVGLALGLLGAGVVWTLVRPVRGPHDRLVGTWVVPR